MPHHHYSFLYTRVQKDLNAVPKDVKTLIFGMFVYMLAWGIVDPFFSIFIHNIVKSYTLTGLAYGAFYLVGVALSLPAGDLAGKINKIKYSIKSILLYPVIGLLYFSLAFVSSGLSIAILFLARALHGIGALFWIMVESFIREKSPKGETSATFGLYMTFNKLAYVVAPLMVIPVVLLFGLTTENVYWLLLALIPFPILSALILSGIKDKGKPIAQGLKEVIVKDGFVKKELDDLRSLGFIGYFTLLMAFFMRTIEVVVSFLIPLYAISQNLGLIEISLLFALINLPYLFSFFLAELADSFGKANLIAVGFALASVALLAIAFSSGVATTFFIACFVLGFILALLQPAVNGLITDITPRVQDGEMTGTLKAVLNIGGFASALILGMLADGFSLQFPFMVLAFLLLGMAALTFLLRGKTVVRI